MLRGCGPSECMLMHKVDPFINRKTTKLLSWGLTDNLITSKYIGNYKLDLHKITWSRLSYFWKFLDQIGFFEKGKGESVSNRRWIVIMRNELFILLLIDFNEEKKNMRCIDIKACLKQKQPVYNKIWWICPCWRYERFIS